MVLPYIGVPGRQQDPHDVQTTWFEKAEDGLRTTRSTADPYNLRVKHGRLDPRRNFFSICVIEDWNSIPAKVKTGSAYRHK